MNKRKRIFHIIQIGNDDDLISRAFDYVIMALIIINLFIALFETYDQSIPYLSQLRMLEGFTVVCFTIEYGLRIWTADFLYPAYPKKKAVLRYVFSLSGLVDLLSVLPFYLPMLFPAGMVAFRMFRVVRILRLFRINAYSDALSVIIDVIKNKRNQLLSSVFIIVVLMIAASLCMYSLEHEAQPDVFCNAFSGFWWSVSTLLTVGYGDIYPITFLGRIFGIIIAFLGVGMVAIPTGIISAGFVEQYSLVKSMIPVQKERPLIFIQLKVDKKHPWLNSTVLDARIPEGMILAGIIREEHVLIPELDTTLQEGDLLVLGAEAYLSDQESKLIIKEARISIEHPWIDETIKNLEHSRRYDILMVYRNGQLIHPFDNLELRAGDLAFFCNHRKSH